MLIDKLNKINTLIGGSLVRKFVIWILLIIILLGVITTFLVQVSLSKTLSEEMSARGNIISKNLVASSVDSLLLEDYVNLDRLIDKVKNIENDVVYVYIVDENNRVLVHTFENGFPIDLLTINKDNLDSHLINSGKGYIIDFRSPILDGRAGYVHVGIDESSMQGKINSVLNQIIGFTLIVGAIGVILAYGAGNYLIGPIHSLVKGTEEYGKGNFGYQIKTNTHDEINVLSKALENMSKNLSENINDLRDSQDRYKKLVDGINDAIISIDSNRKILSWNSAAQKMFGYMFEEMIGKTINHLFANDADCFSEKGDIKEGEWLFIGKNSKFQGSVKTKLLQDGSDVQVVVISDISGQKEKEALEKQILQSDKLATIGSLAAGVAHEINNPLANISLYSQMLMKKKDKTINSKLKIIFDESNRAANISKSLLEFARQSEPKLTNANINLEIEKALAILGHELKGVKLITSLENIPFILIDVEQIKQVLINLISNSIQAIEKNGEIRIKTFIRNNFLNISISDNGCGIQPENISKIFDPFFTTKGLGEGTGLGLSICYGIIKRHNGSIDVESEVGSGTTFTIKLPL